MSLKRIASSDGAKHEKEVAIPEKWTRDSEYVDLESRTHP